MRVLHAGHDADRSLAARPQPRSLTGRDPRGAVRPGLPVHRLREHRAFGPLGSAAAGGRRPRRPSFGAWGGSMTAAPERNGAYGPVPRKEDARFVRGRGTFVDDIHLPRMLHGAILRSPMAHARIVAVDTTAAEAHPRVEAVITGQALAELGLAWMPTISQDAQSVLATDKVRFQGQEVAFVVAQDRYSARDALELIHVEYEALPVVVDAERALEPGAPVIRDDLPGKAS